MLLGAVSEHRLCLTRPMTLYIFAGFTPVGVVPLYFVAGWEFSRTAMGDALAIL